ncbi:hypothetical protein P8452_55323 [Trifolium repens]|nr:hypothetical protein P8452_55323 [Trifolium repens]
MKTLIFASNPSLHFSKHSPFKPKLPIFHPKTSKKFNYKLTTLKPQASAKGFSNTRKPSSTNKKNNDVTINKNPNNKDNDEEDEIPTVVMYRIIGRIFLHLYGELKEREIWNGPLWIPFLTTLVTFGASALGIAYGVLSTSLDAEREETASDDD